MGEQQRINLFSIVDRSRRSRTVVDDENPVLSTFERKHLIHYEKKKKRAVP